MATLGSQFVTIADLASQMSNGQLKTALDTIKETNQILDDMYITEASQILSNITTKLKTYPSNDSSVDMSAWVDFEKAEFEQVEDPCGKFAKKMFIDWDIVEASNNRETLVANQSKAFLSKIGQDVASCMIYGNKLTNPKQFNGLHMRYNALANNVISAGGSGNDNTSIWLVNWDPMGAFMFYPKGTPAGMQVDDWGKQSITRESSSVLQGKTGIQTDYTWKTGLGIADDRYVVRICNIDKSDLITVGSNADTAADLIKYMSFAMNRLPNNSTIGRPVWYMNNTAIECLEYMMTLMTNSQLKKVDLMGRKNVLTFGGIPVRRVDAILNTEATIS